MIFLLENLSRHERLSKAWLYILYNYASGLDGTVTQTSTELDGFAMTDLSRIFDVLVVGGGNAALCAAITARRAGATVLLLERAPRHFRGGNSRHTRNLRYMHKQANDFLTGPYLEDEFWEDLLRVTGGKTNEELARFMIRRSEDMLDWAMTHGVRFQPPLSGTLSLARTNAFFF